VIAAVSAICDPEFSLVGVSGTTDAVTPLVIVNGPIRRALEVNCAASVFGAGFRANATIGRAVRLVWVNVGGARPGVISMSPLGDTLLVIGPEHAATIAADGWSKADVRRFVWEQCQVTVDGARTPKFREPACLHVLVAGGTAGRFSAWVPGWPFRGAPSRLVF